MKKLAGQAHERFVALSVEWAALFNTGKATTSKEEKERCRSRIREINREQERLLSVAD